jgi:predicted dehydrogenase
MPKNKLRVAVVGGGIGTAHIKGYKEVEDLFELVAICDVDQAKAKAVASEYSIPEAVFNFDELCARPDLDVIDICTPPHLHFNMIKQVLEAGKHAICEKPLVSSVEQVDQLKEIQAGSGKQMMPIFQYRFGHGLQKLKMLVEQQVTGKPYVANVDTSWRRRAAYYDVPWRGKWKTENGGAVLGHAIHAHDMLTYILGPIKSVFARTATRVNKIEVEDCASISLEMANGALAALTVTLGSSEEITRHRFSFENLSAESNTRPYTSSGDPWVFTPDTPEASTRIEQVLGEYKPLPEGFAGEFYRFYQAVTNGTTLPVTLDDARNSIELVTAIYLSAQSGLPVELPLRPGQKGYSGWLDWINVTA